MTKIIKSYDMVFDYNKFRNDILAFMQAHELTHDDIDEITNVPSGRTYYILTHDENYKMSTWLTLANAMDIDVRTYFVLDIEEK